MTKEQIERIDRFKYVIRGKLGDSLEIVKIYKRGEDEFTRKTNDSFLKYGTEGIVEKVYQIVEFFLDIERKRIAVKGKLPKGLTNSIHKDFYISDRRSNIRDCIQEIALEIESVKKSRFILGKYERLLSLNDARRRLVKLLGNR